MPLAQWLYRTSLAHAELPAVALGPHRARRYRELAQNATALAGFLRGLKPRRERPVAIVSENRVEILETVFGCWWAGYPVAPIDPSLGAEDLAARLAHAEAEICFASPRKATATLAAAGDGVRHVVEFEGPSYRRALMCEEFGPPQPRPNSAVAWLSYSDREPGDAPRAAAMSHQSLMSLTTSILAEIETIKPRDAQVHALPWSGVSGLTMLPALARGGLNVMPETGDFDPAEFFENVERWRRASTLVSASQLRALIASDALQHPQSFRTIEISGLDLSRPLLERALEKFGPRLARLYGHSAFPLGLTRLNSHDVSARSEAYWDKRVGSVGRPFLSTEIAIREADGGPRLGPSEVGWIQARGLHGMRGYWRDRRSRVSPGGAAWRSLGLRGALDEHGYLTVLGSAKHLLAGPNGEPIAPERIEAALLDSGVGQDVAVARSPKTADAKATGEKIVVFVQKARGGALPESDPEVQPLPIEASYDVEKLPRSPNGRLRRRLLNNWALQRATETATRLQLAPTQTAPKKVPALALRAENLQQAAQANAGGRKAQETSSTEQRGERTGKEPAPDSQAKPARRNRSGGSGKRRAKRKGVA